ncbi:MAG: hypothetical protein JXB62_23515 [Pirellulales bacterium]|nr:hypothetical protein [Pirellulales bacterium]
MTRIQRKAGPVLATAAILLGGFLLGGYLHTQPDANAGVRETTSREHFLAGSERSLPVLKDISLTLRQIEAHLAKIETTITTAAAQQSERPE